MNNVISMLLKPPSECQAFLALPAKDKRKGGIWICRNARKNIANAKKRPPCYCAEHLKGYKEKDSE